MEILLILLIGAGVFYAVRHMKNHKSCSGSCAGCTVDCKEKEKF